MLSSPETEILSPWCPAGSGAPRTAAVRAVLTGMAGNPDSGSQRARYPKSTIDFYCGIAKQAKKVFT